MVLRERSRVWPRDGIHRTHSPSPTTAEQSNDCALARVAPPATAETVKSLCSKQRLIPVVGEAVEKVLDARRSGTRCTQIVHPRRLLVLRGTYRACCFSCPPVTHRSRRSSPLPLPHAKSTHNQQAKGGNLRRACRLDDETCGFPHGSAIRERYTRSRDTITRTIQLKAAIAGVGRKNNK